MRGWKVVFINLCVVLINLWDSFSQIWLPVGSIVGQGVPVVAFTVKVFVYCFTLSGSPDVVLAESKERISSSVSWVVFVDFLDFAIGLCKAKTS